MFQFYLAPFVGRVFLIQIGECLKILMHLYCAVTWSCDERKKESVVNIFNLHQKVMQKCSFSGTSGTCMCHGHGKSFSFFAEKFLFRPVSWLDLRRLGRKLWIYKATINTRHLHKAWPTPQRQTREKNEGGGEGGISSLKRTRTVSVNIYNHGMQAINKFSSPFILLSIPEKSGRGRASLLCLITPEPPGKEKEGRKILIILSV